MSGRLKRAVITGATGPVGLSLIEELLAHQISVVAVCRPRSKRLPQLPKHGLLTVVECPLESISELPKLVSGPCDAFFHFAWDGTYGASRQDWRLQGMNVVHACDAVAAAAELGCTVFVGAGSQSEFGHVEGIMRPDTPCHPDNGYGAAKLAASQMTRSMCAHMGLRHAWCRILSLFGPGEGDYTLISQALDTLDRGERFSCTPGDQVWDYIYSKDAARAFRLVAEKGVDGSVYCFGSGRPRRLRAFLEAVRDVVGRGELGFGERAYYPNQVMHLEADISNLSDDVGFTPLYSFERGIDETLAYRRSLRNGV